MGLSCFPVSSLQDGLCGPNVAGEAYGKNTRHIAYGSNSGQCVHASHGRRLSLRPLTLEKRLLAVHTDILLCTDILLLLHVLGNAVVVRRRRHRAACLVWQHRGGHRLLARLWSRLVSLRRFIINVLLFECWSGLKNRNMKLIRIKSKKYLFYLYYESNYNIAWHTFLYHSFNGHSVLKKFFGQLSVMVA